MMVSELNALQRACSERPIKNTLVAITAVKSTTKIQVNHIGDHKESYIQQYFEDKVKHLSVKITSVQLIRPSAIIEFDNIQGECWLYDMLEICCHCAGVLFTN